MSPTSYQAALPRDLDLILLRTARLSSSRHGLKSKSVAQFASGATLRLSPIASVHRPNTILTPSAPTGKEIEWVARQQSRTQIRPVLGPVGPAVPAKECRVDGRRNRSSQEVKERGVPLALPHGLPIHRGRGALTAARDYRRGRYGPLPPVPQLPLHPARPAAGLLHRVQGLARRLPRRLQQ